MVTLEVEIGVTQPIFGLFQKKPKLKQCCFEWHCSPPSPIHAEAGEGEVLLPCIFPLSLSLPKTQN